MLNVKKVRLFLVIIEELILVTYSSSKFFRHVNMFELRVSILLPESHNSVMISVLLHGSDQKVLQPLSVRLTMGELTSICSATEQFVIAWADANMAKIGRSVNASNISFVSARFPWARRNVEAPRPNV